MLIFLWFLSLVLLIIAPNDYSFTHCLLCTLIFILSALLTIRESSRGGNYVNFTLFFSISVFFVNFFYPVFIYPFDKEYFVVFSRFTFDETIISKATALALIGYTSFSAGVKISIFRSRKDTDARDPKLTRVSVGNSFNLIFVLSILMLLLLFYLTGNGIINRSSDAFFHIEPSILVITQCLVNLLIIYTFYLKRSWWYLGVALLYIIPFLYVGDRGPAIQTLLVILLSYSLFYKQVSRIQILTAILAGFVLLSIISSIRGKGGNVGTIYDVEFASSYDFAMDLIINNRNLYAGYEYVENNGINWGISSIHYIFAPIPKLPSLITTSLFNKVPSELSSAAILTDDAGATWGLGTNLIIDIYMQFHIIGVIVLMGLLGLLVSKLQLNRSNNLFNTVAYIFIFSFSIYIARSSLFDAVRYIAWAAFLYYGIKNFYKPFLKHN